MWLCPKCEFEVGEEVEFCPRCGCKITHNGTGGGLVTAIKIFLILGCIVQGILIIPLAWCLPITISIFNKLKTGEPIGVGVKVCTLLFVNFIAGILLISRAD